MTSRTPTFGPASRRPSTARPGNALPPLANRRGISATIPTPNDPLGRDAKTARVEVALLLADEPLTSRRVAEVAGLTDGHEARRVIQALRALYDADGSAFQVEELAGGYQLLTRPAYHPWLLRLRRTGYDVRLTAAALETLAVIAYKQPIMRAEVESIRGVGCGELIRLLMERGLIRVGGRHDSLGRPQVYVTTKRFLQVFGMNGLEELPEVGSLKVPQS